MPDFQQLSISISQIVSMCLLFVAVIGIMLTYQQMRQNHKIQKANFFKELYTTMFADGDVRAAAYMIEYDKFVYNEDFHGSPQERVVDRLLSFADLVCDLYAQKLLSAHEMDFFNYEFVQIYKNANVQHYLDYLKARYDETGRQTGRDIEPFPAYVVYCEAQLRARGQAGIRL
ncbi:MAG TPA: hypothetical protein VGP82_23435, partial [Ktedonobacterales bacterium]|nr:hypothetical protein [Ktedonobacterales bacterium]